MNDIVMEEISSAELAALGEQTRGQGMQVESVEKNFNEKNLDEKNVDEKNVDGNVCKAPLHNFQTVLLAKVESPLHVSATTPGGLSSGDLYLARERSSGLPIIPASTARGAIGRSLRRLLKTAEQQTAAVITSDDATVVSISDLLVLAIPVRSIAGGFAWVTSPLQLATFSQELARLRIDCRALDELLSKLPPALGQLESLIVPASSLCAVGPARGANQNAEVIVEEFRLAPKISQELAKFAAWLAGELFSASAQQDDSSTNRQSWWQNKLSHDLVVISDELMSHFCAFSLEFTPRMSLDERKLSVRGSLRFEECLPRETVLFGSVALGTAEKDAAPKFGRQFLTQLGRGSSIGRGLLQVNLISENQSSTNQLAL